MADAEFRDEHNLPDGLADIVNSAGDDDDKGDFLDSSEAEKQLMAAAAWYLCEAKGKDGKPLDPVARFHLGNGARLERLNWGAHVSKPGLKNSFGIMANYLYKLDQIEINHESYANTGKVAASAPVKRLKKGYRRKGRSRAALPRQRLLSHMPEKSGTRG